MNEQEETAPEAEIHPLTESKPKAPEVIHYPNVDVIINTNSDSDLWTSILAEEFREGVPDNWVADNELPHIHRAKIQGEGFLAKSRRNSEQPLWKYEGFGKSAQATSNAFNSVMQEVTFAPKVKAAVAADKLQEMARELGWASVEYVEPIIAVVERQTKRKTAVYRDVDARPLPISASINDTGRRLPGDDFMREVRKQIAEQGINAEDLERHQFLYDEEGKLYLTDTEAYTPAR